MTIDATNNNHNDAMGKGNTNPFTIVFWCLSNAMKAVTIRPMILRVHWNVCGSEAFLFVMVLAAE
jgi:hypothetical protein